MDYSKLFSKAWHFLGRHKILWLFGLLAGTVTLGGGGQGLRVVIPGPNGSGLQGFLPGMSGSNLFESAGSVPVWFWVLLAMGLIAFVFLAAIVGFFVSALGQAGLIRGTILADEKQDSTPLQFKQVFTSLKPYYWRLLLLRALLTVAGTLAAALLMLPLILLIISTFGLGLLCLVPLSIVLIPLGWLIQSFFTNIAIAMLDENLGIMAAVERGWQVTTANMGPMLAISAVLALINLVSTLLFMAPLFLAALPALLALLGRWQALQGAAIMVSVIAFIICTVLAIFGSALLSAYNFIVRTLAFRALKDKPAAETLVDATEPLGEASAAQPMPPAPSSDQPVAG